MFANHIDKSFVIDIETTGLDCWRNEILTLSCGVVDIKTQEQINEKEFSFRPTRRSFFNSEAEKIHGISLERALTFPESRGEWIRFIDFLKQNTNTPQIMCCHALWFGKYFDSNFISCQLDLLELNFEKRKYIGMCVSTHSMAKIHYGTGEPLNLKALSLKHEIELNHHDAKSDREACQKLFKYFYQRGVNDEYANPRGEEGENFKTITSSKKGNGKRNNRQSLS